MNKSQGAFFWAGSFSVSAFAKENKTSTPWFLLFRAPWVSWHSTFGPVLSLGQHWRNMPQNLSQEVFFDIFVREV